MGNVTKHKGVTKGDGKLAVCDCYGDEELKGDKHSCDEEPREGEMDTRYLTGGDGTQIHR